MGASIFAVFYSLMVAFTTDGGVWLNEPEGVLNPMVMQVNMHVEIYMWDLFFAGATWICSMYPISQVNYNPISMDYEFFLGIKWGIFTIYVDHWCSHPLTCYQTFIHYNPIFEGGTTQFCIQLSGWF